MNLKEDINSVFKEARSLGNSIEDLRTKRALEKDLEGLIAVLGDVKRNRGEINTVIIREA